MQHNKPLKIGAISLLIFHVFICFLAEPILDQNFYKYADVLGCGYGLIILTSAMCQYFGGITSFGWNLVMYAWGLIMLYHCFDAIYCTSIYLSEPNKELANNILNESSEMDNAFSIFVSMVVYTLLFCYFIRNRK